MNDTLFFSLLNQAIESHCSVSAPVRTYAESSTNPAVRTAWEEYQALEQLIASWKSNPIQIDLTNRVMAELFPPVSGTVSVESGTTLQNFMRHSWSDLRAPANRSGTIAIAVASVLLLLGTFIISVPHAPHAEIVLRERHQPPNPVNQVTVASVEWAQRAGSAVAETIVTLPSRSADLIDQKTWNMNWSMRLEPLRRDARDAWKSLIDELPMEQSPQS